MGGEAIRALRRVAGRRADVERAWKRKDRDLGGWIFERASAGGSVFGRRMSRVGEDERRERWMGLRRKR